MEPKLDAKDVLQLTARSTYRVLAFLPSQDLYLYRTPPLMPGLRGDSGEASRIVLAKLRYSLVVARVSKGMIYFDRRGNR